VHAVFSDEQELLRQTVCRLARSTAPAAPNPGELPTCDDWSTLVDTGLTALGAPGREGLTAIDVAIVCEALGQNLSTIPFLGSCVFPSAVLADVAPDHELLDALGSGHQLPLLLDPTLFDLTTEPGSVAFDALGANEALVATPAGLAAVAVSSEPLPCADLTRAVFPCPIYASASVVAPLPDEKSDWKTLPLVAVCADMVGVMAGALQTTIDYVSDRKQFGQPIGSFQAVQHLCAEQRVLLEAARSITYYAAWSCDHEDADAVAAARNAKIYVGDAARTVTEAAMQLHGGIGITWESNMHLYLRRALLDRQLLGSPSALLRLVADRFRR
jgi:alkylation response protein AidB-like acyl-CoA dehydrogenase